ncbi:MAG: hypothetical protein ACYDAD_15430 [Acidimicrobiales bacterium]
MGPRRYGDHWLWVGGPVPPGADAITIGSLVCVRRAAASDPVLLAHEAVHVRQWRELGPVRFLVSYLGAYLRWRARGCGHAEAYRRIPLEVEAYAAAASRSEGTGPSGASGK